MDWRDVGAVLFAGTCDIPIIVSHAVPRPHLVRQPLMALDIARPSLDAVAEIETRQNLQEVAASAPPASPNTIKDTVPKAAPARIMVPSSKR